ncbi:hypothetical protein VKS41_008340 [Umbelopsis sp. WA50703]
MQQHSALRAPLSQKSSNAQPIDLTSSMSKRHRLSLASTKALKQGQTQDESGNRSVPNKQQQKTVIMPDIKAAKDSQDLPQLKQESWSSEDELIRPHKQMKTNAGVVKRRTLSDRLKAPANVPVEATAPISSTSANKEPAIASSIDTVACPSSMSSPLYNGDHGDLLKSSPMSPMFYEKIVPQQILSDDSDSSSDDFEMLAVKKSPLDAKQRRNQVQQRPAAKSTTTAGNAQEKLGRNASRSILSDLTGASIHNTQPLSMPHISGQGLSDIKVSGNSKKTDKLQPPIIVSSNKQAMKEKAVHKPRMQTCPICNQDFSASVIEVHASDCTGEPRINSQSTSKPTKQSSLQWSFPKKKAFTVYRDDEQDVRSTEEDTKGCPICHEQVAISLFQQHVDSELDDLTSGVAAVSERNTAFQSDVQSPALDDYASDSECSVIDLATGQYSYWPSASTAPSKVPLDYTESTESTEWADPIGPARERSFSPVEGFQDIRQLKEQDPGYQMYFQQFNGRSGSRRGRNKSTGDGQDECAQTTTSRAKAGSSKAKPYKAKPSSAAYKRYRQFKRKGKK